MKKKLCSVLCLILSLCLLLCSCSDSKTSKEATTKHSVKVEGNSAGQTLANVDYEDPESFQTTAPAASEPIAVNEHYNPNNNIIESGRVTIRPCYVRWEGSVLVADCYVLNGLDNTIANINVKTLRLSNRDGVIAEGSFGELKNLTLAPGQYAVWTFRFLESAIVTPDADLIYLPCYNLVSWNNR